MSLFPYILLPKGRPDEAAALGHDTPPNPDDARNINAAPEERTVQATLSEVNGACEVEFVRNVPLRVCFGGPIPKSICFLDDLGASNHHTTNWRVRAWARTKIL